jgi:hypothetical protein
MHRLAHARSGDWSVLSRDFGHDPLSVFDSVGFLDQVEGCDAEYYYIMRDSVWYCGSPYKGSKLVALTEALAAIQETAHA